MRNPLAFSVISLLLLIPLFSCNSKKEESPQFEGKTPQKALTYFEEAKEVKDSREKLVLLNHALDEIDSKNDTLLPLLLDFKIYYHNSLKEYDSSLYFADSLVKTAIHQKDTADIANAYYRKARIHHYLQNLEKVYNFSSESRKFSLAINDSVAAGKRSLEMALAQNRSGDYTGGQETATQALRFLEKSEDSMYKSSVYNAIGLAYREQQLNEDAASEFKNALRFSTSKKDSLSMLNNLALVLRDKKEYEEAFEIWKKLISESETDAKRARYIDNLAFARWLQDSTLNIITELQTALNSRLEAGDKEGLLASYDHFSEYYKNKNVALSKFYAEKLLETAIDLGNPTSEINAYQKLIPISPLSETRQYTRRLMYLNDSIQTVNLRAKNTFAKIRYDEERKQQEILNLEAQNAVQVLEAERLRNQRLIGILGVTLIIMGFLFIFYLVRQRHKKEKIQEVYKTEGRISKRIHDELANDIFNVMSSLEPVAPVPVIDKLENIYIRTRDISRENSDIETGEHFIGDLLSNLSNITPEDSKFIIRGESDVQWEKIDKEKKIVIYRVLQELMVNMKKHSKATLVAIIFDEQGKVLEINYSDNGCGIDPTILRKKGGLQNVENRISAINGKISFETEEGKGFRALIRVPV